MSTHVTATVTPMLVHRPQPAHRLLDNLAAGASSLYEQVSAWPPMLPKPAELAGAVSTVEGLRRLLAELHHHVGGEPDAA